MIWIIGICLWCIVGVSVMIYSILNDYGEITIADLLIALFGGSVLGLFTLGYFIPCGFFNKVLFRRKSK
jgi:hypothetical protein